MLDAIEHIEALALSADAAKKGCQPGADLDYLTARELTLANMAKFLRDKLSKS